MTTGSVVPSPPRAHWMSFAAVVLAGLTALVFLRTLLVHAINVPVTDDYFAILDFLLHWTDAAGGDRLGLLWSQFYSHRIPVNHLMAAGLVSFTGHCDLRVLQGVAWLAWLALAASVALAARPPGRTGLSLLLVSLLLLQPQGFTNLLTATGSPGHAGCLLAAFWSLHLLGRKTRSALIGSLLLAALATCSSANGLLLFPLAVAGHAWDRRWRTAAIWFGAGVAAWIGYLAGYSVAEQPFTHQAFLPLSLFLNVTTMMGAPLAFGRTALPCLVMAGTLIGATAVLLVVRAGFKRTVDRDALFLLFLLGSVAMTAWARLGWSHEYMLQDRYRPYGILLLAVLTLNLLTLAGPARRGSVTFACLAGAAIFWALSYAQTCAELKSLRSRAEATAMNVQLGRWVPLAAAPELFDRAAVVLEAAAHRGLVRFPRLLDDASVSRLRQDLAHPAPAPTTRLRAAESNATEGRVIVPDAAWLTGRADPALFGLIYQGTQPLIVPVVFLRARLTEFFTRGRLLSDRYELTLPTNAPVMQPAVFYLAQHTPGGSFAIQATAFVESAP